MLSAKLSTWREYLVPALIVAAMTLVTVAGSAFIGATDLGLIVIGALIALVGGALVITRLDFGLYVLVAFVFLNLSDVLKEAIGIPSMVRPLVALIFINVMQTRVIMQRKPLIFRTVEGSILLYGIVIMISAFFAVDQERANDRLFDWFKDFIILLVIIQLSDNESHWKRVQWIIILSAALLSSLSLYQTVTGDYVNTFWGLAKAPVHQITNGFDSVRITGPLDDPNFYAQILLMVVPMAAYRALTDPEKRLRRIAMFCLLVTIAGVVLTYSRGAFLAMIIIGILIAQNLKVDMVRLLVVSLVVIALIMPILPAGYLDRIMTLDEALPADSQMQTESSFRGRSSEMIVAMEMFSDHPLLGVGPGNYPVHYQAYSSRVGLDDRVEARKAHSFYLETAAEKGVMGIGALILLVGILFASTYQAKGQLRSIKRDDLIPWMMGIEFSFLSFMMTSIFLHESYSRYMWLIVALMASCSVLSQALVNRKRAI